MRPDGQLDIPRLAVTGEQSNTQTGGLPEQFRGYGGGGRVEQVDIWSSASAEVVVQRATESNIATTIVSPLKGLFPSASAPHPTSPHPTSQVPRPHPRLTCLRDLSRC